MAVAVLIGAGVGLADSGSARVGAVVARGGEIPIDGEAGVAVSSALLEALGGCVADGMAGVLPWLGVASGTGAGVGRGVGVLIAIAIGAAGARTATGTTSGSVANTLVSRSAASAACGLGGGISGIAPISQAW